MRRALSWLTAVWMLLAPSAASAGSCTVNSAGLAFGPYSSGVSWHVDSEGTLSFTCTGVMGEVVVFTVSLSAGGGGSGFNPRRLRSGANEVQYNVYTDPARTRVWGDGTSGTFTETGSVSIAAGPTPKNLPIYGRVFGGQSPPPGTYTDSLLITLSF